MNVDPDSDEARMLRHRELNRMVHPDVLAAHRTLDEKEAKHHELIEFIEYWVVPHMEKARADAFARGDKVADGYLNVLTMARSLLGK